MPPVALPHIQPRQVGRTRARVLLGLKRDAEGATEQVEVVDVQRSEIDLQGVEHVRQGQTQQFRLVAIEVVVELRRRGAERREQLLRVKFGLLARLGDHRLHRVVEREAAAAAEIFNLELKAAGGAEARNRRRIEAQRERARNRQKLGTYRRDQFPRRFATAAAHPTVSGSRTRTAEFDCAALVRKLRR